MKTIFKFGIVCVFIALVIAGIYFCKYRVTQDKVVIQKTTLTQYEEELQESENRDRQDIPNLKNKYHCDFDSNAQHTSCLEENLKKASIERRWKQNKLETINHPAINLGDLSVDLAGEQSVMKKWGDNFEKSRDLWCQTSSSFVRGSGTQSFIAECRLELEILAIHQLNTIYYSNVMNLVLGSKGFADFELKE